MQAESTRALALRHAFRLYDRKRPFSAASSHARTLTEESRVRASQQEAQAGKQPTRNRSELVRFENRTALFAAKLDMNSL